MKHSLAARIMVALASIMLMLGGISILYGSSPLWTGTVIPDTYRSSDIADEDKFNLLVTGIMNENGAALAEMTAVMNFNDEDDSLGIMYLPGVTYVGEDNVKYGRLNGAFNWGTSSETKGGITALADCINNLLCVPVDHYISFDMKILPQVLDIIGEVSFRLDEDLPFEDRTLEAGDHVFGSKEVLRYILTDSRNNASSVSIIRNCFMDAVVCRIFELSPSEFLTLMFKCRKGIDTDLSVKQIWELSKKYSGSDPSSRACFTVPGTYRTGYGAERLTIWSIDRISCAEKINNVLRKDAKKILLEDLLIPEITVK